MMSKPHVVDTRGFSKEVPEIWRMRMVCEEEYSNWRDLYMYMYIYIYIYSLGEGKSMVCLMQHGRNQCDWSLVRNRGFGEKIQICRLWHAKEFHLCCQRNLRQQEFLSRPDGERVIKWGNVGRMMATFRSSFWLLHSKSMNGRQGW